MREKTKFRGVCIGLLAILLAAALSLLLPHTVIGAKAAEGETLRATLAGYDYDSNVNLLDLEGQPVRLVANGDANDPLEEKYEGGVLTVGNSDSFGGSVRLTNDYIESGKVTLESGEEADLSSVPLMWRADIKFVESNGESWVGGGFSFGKNASGFTVNLRAQTDGAYHLIMKKADDNYAIDGFATDKGATVGVTRKMAVIKDGNRYTFFVGESKLGAITGEGNASAFFGIMAIYSKLVVSNMSFVPLVKIELPEADVSDYLAIQENVSFAVSGTGAKSLSNPYADKSVYKLCDNSHFTYRETPESGVSAASEFTLDFASSADDAELYLCVRKSGAHSLKAVFTPRTLRIEYDGEIAATENAETEAGVYKVKIFSEPGRVRVTAGGSSLSYEYAGEGLANAADFEWCNISGGVRGFTQRYAESVFASSPVESYPQFPGKAEVNTESIEYVHKTEYKTWALALGIVLAALGVAGAAVALTFTLIKRKRGGV